MNHFVFKAVVLLATAMLSVQIPLCLCSHALGSHDAAEVIPPCLYHVARHKHDGNGDPQGSHQRASEGRNCPCPGTCQCLSVASPAAIPANAEAADSTGRQILTSLHRTAVFLPVIPSSPEGLGHHASSAGPVMQAGIFGQGDPCALLSCWLL